MFVLNVLCIYIYVYVSSSFQGSSPDVSTCADARVPIVLSQPHYLVVCCYCYFDAAAAAVPCKIHDNIQPNSQPASQLIGCIDTFVLLLFMIVCRAKCGLPCCEFQHHDNELTLPIVEWIKSIRTSFSSSSSSCCWLYFPPFCHFISILILLSFSISFLRFRYTHSMEWVWVCDTFAQISRLIITAVSPNVVIDIVLWLKIEKLGLYKGIHTIIIAVTTINDVLSIFLFNVILGIIFSTGMLLLFFCFSFFPLLLMLLLLWLSFSFFCFVPVMFMLPHLLTCLFACIRICTVIDFLFTKRLLTHTYLSIYLSSTSHFKHYFLMV